MIYCMLGSILISFNNLTHDFLGALCYSEPLIRITDQVIDWEHKRLLAC